MRYVLLTLLALVLLGVGGFVWLGWYSAIAPVTPPARASFPPDMIARGAQLAALGDCGTCHTAPGGAAFAGGLKLQTPFGAIYSTNITPDPQTGIGTWSAAAFHRAMHQGVDRRGRLLYPAFPYDHFTLLTEADNQALYAYLMTRHPVRATAPANDLPFPLRFRPVLALWRLLFFRAGTFHADAGQNAEWNRGAYLVGGIAHCGACHTTRNVLGAEKSHAFGGGEAQDWYAYALDHTAPAREPWTADRLYDYLRRGWQAQHGAAVGPMRDVTDDLATTPDADLHAIAAYMASHAATQPRTDPATPPPAASSAGAALYRATCAACHENTVGPPYAGIALADSSAVRAPNPTNLANIVVQGIPPAAEQPGPIMPGFGAVLSNRQIAELLRYLRTRFGAAPAWDQIDDAVKAARHAMTEAEATP